VAEPQPVLRVEALRKKFGALTVTDGIKQDTFGYCVSASRDLVVVGAPNDSVAGNKSGTAYLYSRNLGSPDGWNQLKRFTGSDSTGSDQFGFAAHIEERA